MRRRHFLALMGASAAARGLPGHAQQMPVIGFVSSRSPGESAGVVAAFRQGLRDMGFIEGQNLVIAFRWAEGHYDRLPALASELVSLPVALLFAAGGPPAAFAAKTATPSIPIVFSAVSDPVEIGLVPSLSSPGGNITGMGVFSATLGGKRIELIKEMMRSVSVFGYLLNPANPSSDVEANGALAAARALGVELRVLRAKSTDEILAAFETISGAGIGALVVSGEPFFDSQREAIVGLSLRRHVPAIFGWREYVLAGGLMSYGSDLPDSYRQAAIYAGRILKGEKPANLPVMQPAKFNLAINSKTAKTLGLEVPPLLLARADEVIE
jgi:putative ABC transport system substrate-binding protein